jgi:UDP-N-acetylglucosamine--N-acetylmuramyl-(pentapeptide) pyrophosphoryl-undecaprenol N-acetylglucosamine transferase
MAVVIAGGGTGGHIYPAISIARAIQQIAPDEKIEFVGTPTGLESKLVPRAGFSIHYIPIGKLNRNVPLIERLKTLLQLPVAIFKSFFLLLKLRPRAVIGVGGYASGPIVFAAALMGFRTFIWEPNAYPGLANRLLARFVDRCLVVFEEAARFLHNKNVIRVHMPVRKEIEALGQFPHTAHLNEFRLLVFGGSQGARPLNNALLEALRRGGAWLEKIKIVHQTGPTDFARVAAEYEQLGPIRERVEVCEYLHDMPERLKWADLILARSGTGTISELAASGRGAILVPLPTAADDHQTKNAEALVKIGGAVLLPQKELTAERLIHEIEAFEGEPQKLSTLAKKIRDFHKPDAAREIAQLVLAP